MHRAAKKKLKGPGGLCVGYSGEPFRKAFLRGRCMNRSVQGREPGDGVEAFKDKGMVYVKTEGQEGAQCMRAQNRTCMGWTRKAGR